jgi:HK97 family phage portal protein
MVQKNIFGKPDLENLVNKIIFNYISKGSPFALTDSPETYITNGYAGNVNIYPIIRKIVNATVGVKWILKDQTTGEPAADQTLMNLIQRPNNYQSQQALFDELVTWRLVTGNRYIYWIAPTAGANRGKPVELHIMPASQTEIIQGTWLDPVGGYRILIGDTWKVLPAEQVIHGKTVNLKYDTSGSQLYGMSPLQSALNEMTASKYAYEGLSKQYENGGPDVIITNTEGMVKGQPEYTEEQKQSLWAAFKSKFGGSKNKGKWLIKNLPVEVHEIGKSPVDLNTLDFLKLTLRDFCNIYGVPSILMNDPASATYNNMKEAVKALWNSAVIPELEYLKEDLNRIAAVYNKAAMTSCVFDYDLSDIPELQDDKSVQATGLSAAHWMTQNERRQAMGLEPIEGLDELLIPMGLIPMSEMMQPTDQTDIDTANKYLDRNGIKY